MLDKEPAWLEEINWQKTPLLPAVAQDIHSGRILMLAWVNVEALRLTIKEQRAIYWSRSRNKLWRKGEESGHIQKLHHVFLDCDADTLIYQVEQVGGIACHTGRESCFFRHLTKEGQWKAIDPVLKNPKSIY